MSEENVENRETTFSTCLGKNIVKTYKSLITIGTSKDYALRIIKIVYDDTSAYSNGTGLEILDAYNALIAVVTSCVDSWPSCEMVLLYYATSSSATISS